jgi:Leucine-rich repeat (LRR) protein
MEYLNLSSRSLDLKTLPEALGSFTKQKYLNLSGCGWIEELPKTFGNLQILVHLDLS